MRLRGGSDAAAGRPFLSELRSLTGDKGGRFLAAVLKEVGRQAPELLERIFTSRSGEPLRLRAGDEIVIEYPYRANRRADLAVLREGTVIALGEIKYRDHRDVSIGEQLLDYLKHCSRRDVHFALVTELPPRIPDRLHRHPRLHVVTYHDVAIFAEAVRPRTELAAGALQMLLEFLRREVTMYEPRIDIEALQLLAVRTGGFWRGTANVSSRSRERLLEVPDALHRIMSNIAWVGDKMSERIGRRSILDFEFERGEAEGVVRAWVSASVHEGKGRWMQLRFGTEFAAFKVKNEVRYRSAFFSLLLGGGFDYGDDTLVSRTHRWDSRWPEPGELLARFASLARDSVAATQRANPQKPTSFWRPATRAVEALRVFG